ncbi:MAG: serine/threonine protein kinase [Pseudomonadota bacterium]|nr:serine/threonine protein kinase [Pseudomonadota bacterium]
MDAAERDTWREADRILDALLDLAVQERAAALAAMTLSPALRRRVEQLLFAQADAGPLDLALPDTAWPASPPDALSGRQLGRWLLQHEIGRGGMAVVYRAQSLSGPSGQIAAVKVLSLGTVARSGHERLFIEQQALLRLRHPFIASLYEAGLADDDTPWLAMELVEGESIDTWCARHALDEQARVRLVLQVAEALAYAHRNLVIHRDIKPSNVMVDRDGHVRLLDFGIARLTDAVGDRTVTSMLALTPAYAAPEQLLGAPPSTSMDVHGLGALLQRLLKRTRGERHARDDLGTILSKALAEQPEARYASVEAMADDLTRWLQRRPIRARPPSWRYLLSRFAVRHRALLLGGVAIVALGAAAIYQIVLQRDRAEVQAQRAVAVRDFLSDVFQATDPSTGTIPDALDLLEAGSTRARSELLPVDPMTAADVLLISGGARNALNDYDRAGRDLHLALRILEGIEPAPARELSRVHWQLGLLYSARGPLSVSAHHREQAARWVARWDAPAEERMTRELSMASGWAKVGRQAEAEALMRRLLDELRDQGLEDTQLHLDALNALTSLLAIAQRDMGERMRLHEERIAVARRLFGPDNGWYAYTLADSVPTMRKSPAHLARAEAIAREAVDITARIYDKPHMFTAVAECNLAALLMEDTRYPEAIRHYDRNIEVDRALQRRDLHAQSCIAGRARARAESGDTAGALADLEDHRAMLVHLEREKSAMWMGNCAQQARLMLGAGDRTGAAALLQRCEAEHQPGDGKPLPEEFLEVRRLSVSSP